jgi:hypothetical protein
MAMLAIGMRPRRLCSRDCCMKRVYLGLVLVNSALHCRITVLRLVSASTMLSRSLLITPASLTVTSLLPDSIPTPMSLLPPMHSSYPKPGSRRTTSTDALIVLLSPRAIKTRGSLSPSLHGGLSRLNTRFQVNITVHHLRQSTVHRLTFLTTPP